jgi:hypothetical protein
MLLLGLVLPAAALQRDDGMQLTVQVEDPNGRRVPTASIRIPAERVSHAVNRDTGRWRADRLFIADTEVLFRVGDEIAFDVRAPGYVPIRASYRLVNRAKGNVVRVTLIPVAGFDGPGPRKVHQEVDWSAVAETLGQPRAQLTPAFFASATEGGARGAAEIAVELASLGSAQADAALEWANDAMDRAGAELTGADYVAMMTRMYAVRATASQATWQAREMENLARGGVDTSIARRRAAEAADDWLDYARAAGTDESLALALCVSAAEDPARCE